MIYDCLIIGAGASGLYCACRLLYKHKCSVAIIDSNHVPGKKLLLTGGGRCNLSNSTVNTDNYFSDDNSAVESIIRDHDPSCTVNFFEQVLGMSVTSKDNLIYPSTFRSSTVVDALYNYLIDKNADMFFDETVDSVIYNDGYYLINGTYRSRCVVFAAGGASYPKTGSNGSYMSILSNLSDNVTVLPLRPSLVPLIAADRDIKKLSGARIYCDICLYSDNTLTDRIASSSGELLFTDYGISGIMVLDISGAAVRLMARGGKPVVSINLLKMSTEQAKDLIERLVSMFPNRRVIDAISGIIRDDILLVVLGRIKLNRDKECHQMSAAEVNALAENLTSFRLIISGSKDLDMAQVTTGGISFSSVDNNLQIKGLDKVFVCGESLNCDGICGGYNLQFAWSSADKVSEGVINCLK